MNNTTEKYLNRRNLLQSVGAYAGITIAENIFTKDNHTQALINDSKTNSKIKPEDNSLTIPTWYYQHFDADYNLKVPEENFGGWKKTELDFSRKHTAVVVMHAWEMGTKEKYPGWWRAVPYAPRSQKILQEVFPPLLKSVRDSHMTLFHVVAGGRDYWKNLPGYKRAVALAGPDPAPMEKIASDPKRDVLDEFRRKNCFVGQHNQRDVNHGFAALDFAPQARPQGEEGVAQNSHQLFTLCKYHNINHLVYCGFAINWCLLLSPGGMAEMHKYGLMCSALRQATTAVENKSTARKELCKEIALWRVALAYGFVFDVDDFMQVI